MWTSHVPEQLSLWYACKVQAAEAQLPRRRPPSEWTRRQHPERKPAAIESMSILWTDSALSITRLHRKSARLFQSRGLQTTRSSYSAAGCQPCRTMDAILRPVRTKRGLRLTSSRGILPLSIAARGWQSRASVDGKGVKIGNFYFENEGI